MFNTPIVTKQKFADSLGLPVSVVNDQIQKGYYPVIKVGKYVFVNLQALTEHASKHGEKFVFKK